MSRTLKNGRFASIEDAQFENDRGVTKAIDTESGASVMIKWITVKGPRTIIAAEEEAGILRDLSVESQFIVRFVDFLPKVSPEWWEWNAFSFIVMEFCPEGSLKDWIEARREQGRRTSVKEATLIATQLAMALSFCHSKKIAHLDVKPANVMMMADGCTIKLGDFGISTLLDSVRDTITTKGLQGVVEHTVLYITPEFLRNQVDSKSPRIDVWGFGLVLQELITLEHAFGRHNAQPADDRRIVKNMKRTKRTPFSEILGENNDFTDFEVLIQKCLNPSRESRPDNMMMVKNEEIFAEVVERIENGELPSDIMATPAQIIKKLREENEQKDRQIQMLENIVNKQIRENDKVKQEFDAQRENWEEESAKFKQEINILQRESVASRKRDQEWNQLKFERKNWQKEAEKMRREIQELQKNLKSLLDENDRNQRKIGEMDLQRNRFRIESENQKKENEELKREIQKFGKEKEEREKRKETRVKQLMKLEREIGVKYVNDLYYLAGCYYGDDRSIKHGGPRDGFNKEVLRSVLRLLALGGRVNIKLCTHIDEKAAFEDWELEYRAACKSNGNGRISPKEDANHYLWIKSKENFRFHAVVQQFRGDDGIIKDTKEMTSVPDGGRQLLKIKFVCGSAIRFNIFLL
ncbi:Oidioi.mRNA.OKI2018_I69.chr2.g5429.t1.cds [Oikopleura dioica]|uniref:Oidioi.mRNA.OKI2018_I69.chr2.g5429.t1.cds n=1 Tax=Oikopleura dioica TaxID=34765 RepID=A0ABN7T9G3_OIKDI|nr:Oidioi.mRNA.OKI2018_I69.chr2.g5429.t1.cds [Oikopleura dioica]